MSVDVLFHQIVTNLWRDTPHTHIDDNDDDDIRINFGNAIHFFFFGFVFVLSYLQLQPTNQSGYRTPNRTETPIHVLMMPVEILVKYFIEYLHHWTKSGSHSHQVKCWDKPFRAYMTLLNIQPAYFYMIEYKPKNKSKVTPHVNTNFKSNFDWIYHKIKYIIKKFESIRKWGFLLFVSLDFHRKIYMIFGIYCCCCSLILHIWWFLMQIDWLKISH